jgi:S-adenosylmethionine uptake transporter
MLATQRAPANHVAPTQYSQMLWAVLFGYLLIPRRAGLADAARHRHHPWRRLFTLVREEKVTPWWRRAKLV